VSPQSPPVAIRYERDSPTSPWRVTGLVASDRHAGIDSVWMKRFKWRGLGNPHTAAALVWQAQPSAEDVERVYDQAGRYIGDRTAAGLKLPAMPAGELTPAASPTASARDDHRATDRDSFYIDVARTYHAGAANTGKPVEAVAQQYGVARTTAVNWVREARVRGHLPPAQRGKAT
jgi:hypothetical protein